MIESKFCPRCKQEKPLIEFGKDKKNKSGYSCWCKQCKRKCSREWVTRNANNPQHVFKTLRAVNRAKNRKKIYITEKEFVDWYIHEPKICAYCNIPEDKVMILPEHHKMNRTRLAVDCKTNSLDYRKGNIVLACGRCNSMKGDIFGYDVFREIAQKYVKPLWQELLKE